MKLGHAVTQFHTCSWHKMPMAAFPCLADTVITNISHHSTIHFQYMQLLKPQPQPLLHPSPNSFSCVKCWFKYLGEHEEHNKDGIQISKYCEVLHDKGFL